MINGHGGNIYKLSKELGCQESEIIDMSSNLNPMGEVPGLLDWLNNNIKSALRLPEVDSMEIINLFAQKYNINPLNLLAGNGTTQFIYIIPQSINFKKTLVIVPTYADYEDSLKQNKIDINYVYLDENKDFKPEIDKINHALKKVDSVFICNPNNPTASIFNKDELLYLINENPDVIFIIDESYLDFVKNGSEMSMINIEKNNLILLYSMSKIFSIPGLRLGFMKSTKNLRDKISTLIQPWSVNSLAHMAAKFLLNPDNCIDSFINQSIKYLINEKKVFINEFKNISNIKIYNSKTSFILIKLLTQKSNYICQELARQKILIRNCSNFKGLNDNFIRVSLKQKNKNELLIMALRKQLQI